MIRKTAENRRHTKHVLPRDTSPVKMGSVTGKGRHQLTKSERVRNMVPSCILRIIMQYRKLP